MPAARNTSGAFGMLLSPNNKFVNTSKKEELNILTRAIRFLHIIATDLEYVRLPIIEIMQAEKLQSISLKRRYSSFTIDHDRCSTFFSLSSYLTENTVLITKTVSAASFHNSQRTQCTSFMKYNYGEKS
jgi:hypothetical protein